MKTKMNKVLQGLNIDAECVHYESHRHLAFFDLELSPNTPVRKIESALREIALGIRSKTTPILKVMSDKGIVRLQVAMADAETVSLRTLLLGDSVPQHMIFPMMLGEDECGRKLWMDMAKNPHLIVAGGTGSGKSVLLHTLITNAILGTAVRAYQAEIYLIDPKRVEFSTYRDPIYSKVVVSIKNTYEETLEVLSDLKRRMESRYEEMEKCGVRSIEDDRNMYSHCFLVIDEIADLMLQDKSGELAKDLVTIAQKGRAAGIFMVLATQRPSVDILPGVIKANFPGRIACKTASKIDSKVVLDEQGAEELLGRGDALLKNMEHDRVRFQVAYTDSNDVKWYYREIVAMAS
jgi:S-DNA-T family DNA segregation ATPase FtsK/SpoIIIE